MALFRIFCLISVILGVIMCDNSVHVTLQVVIVVIVRIMIPCLWSKFSENLLLESNLYLNHICPSSSILIVVGAVIQVQVPLLFVLASDAALDLTGIADHVNQVNHIYKIYYEI